MLGTTGANELDGYRRWYICIREAGCCVNDCHLRSPIYADFWANRGKFKKRMLTWWATQNVSNVFLVLDIPSIKGRLITIDSEHVFEKRTQQLWNRDENWKEEPDLSETRLLLIYRFRFHTFSWFRFTVLTRRSIFHFWTWWVTSWVNLIG